MGPVVAPVGTMKLRLVALVWLRVACVPFTVTELLASVFEKPVPDSTTDAPTLPPAGLKPVIVGVTCNDDALVPWLPSTLTITGPLTAPEGTVTVRLVAIAAVTLPVAPPVKRTTLFERLEGSKPEPVRPRLSPTWRLVELRPVTWTVTDSTGPRMMSEPTCTVTWPEVAPEGI
ncbi:hypothetical protein D3C87_1392630 [compost metagenome]